MWIFVIAVLALVAVVYLVRLALKNFQAQSAWEDIKESQPDAVIEPARQNTTAARQLAYAAAASRSGGVPSKPSPVASKDQAEAPQQDKQPGKELWIDSNYCWVVICKNHWFHRHPNLFNVHRIPLGETDAVLTRPLIDQPFTARCDECKKEYVYKPSDVLRYEMELPDNFVPHSLFRV